MEQEFGYDRRMRGLVVVLCLVAGCFQDPYDVDKYWSELANAHCSSMQYCCTRADYTDWWTDDSDGDRHDCVAAHAAPEYAETIRADIRSGRITFDPAAARSCVIALENLPCADFQPGIRYRETYCTPPLHGNMPNDATGCTIDEQCASGFCDRTGYTFTCRARLPAGADCSLAGNACEKGMYCQDNHRCGYGGGAGAACDNDTECIGDWCKSGGIFAGGTCYQACQSG
jgi:hypothetical protein